MYKKKFLITISLVLLALLGIISLNYIIDPFHIFHRTRFNKGFSGEQRLQNAGLIKNFLAQDGYNSIIMGTSLTECFDSKYVNRKMNGWKTIKLSMSGSSGKEQVEIIRKSIKKANIKNVILEARHYVINDDKYKLQEYLYDDNLFNDINYLTSLKILKFYFGKERIHEINKRNNWCLKAEKSFKRYNSEDNLKKLALELKEKRSNFKYEPKRVDFNLYEKYIDLFNQYPDVNFYVVIPPNNFHHLIMNHNELNYLKDIVLFFSNFENVRVFGFDDVKKITHDSSNYKDVEHFRAWINEFIIDSIAENKHELKHDNIDNYISRILGQVKTYKVRSKGKYY